MKDLDGLIARVEQATGPDRELDFDLMCLWNSVAAQMTFKATNAAPDWYIPACTSSIDAALGLMERVLPGIWYVMAKGRLSEAEPLFACELLIGEEQQSIADGPTQALAIILATLKALQSLPEGDAR